MDSEVPSFLSSGGVTFPLSATPLWVGLGSGPDELVVLGAALDRLVELPGSLGDAFVTNRRILDIEVKPYGSEKIVVGSPPRLRDVPAGATIVARKP